MLSAALFHRIYLERELKNMIAIYARQSVDRADSISIENQIDFCKYETRGESFQTYIDRGYSGKNTNRPEFMQMMEDIKEGSVQTVVVYKLDRISRSIMDFSNMMEIFEKHRVQFISATEKFDTSSPMGKAMLNICIVFAQLERETIQKRVADAYFARSQKSFYMGGRIPYGFRKKPAVIDGIHTSMYEIEPEEAEQVKLIYELYAQRSCSFGDIITKFNEMGITKRGKPWERTRIRDILINPVYVKADLDVYDFYKSEGVEIANDPSDFIGTNGCYYYKGRDFVGRKHTVLEGNNLVLAPHEGIISSDIWLACRRKCLSNGQVRPCQKAKNTWLAGKIKCGVCGYALVDKHNSAHNSRYLLCSHRMNSKACDGPGRLYTDEIEAVIYGLIREKLSEFKKLSKSSRPRIDPEITQLNVEKIQIENEIKSLLAKVADSEEVLLRYINERIRELDDRKAEIDLRVKELNTRKQACVRKIENYSELWDDLSFDDKRQTVDILIRVIYATSSKITIEWRI